MNMQELVAYVVKGLVDHPDEVAVNKVEGDASVMLELSVNSEDIELVKGDDGATLHHLRAVVSAASSRRKAVLELLDGGSSSKSEE